DFTTRDTAGAPRVAMINEWMARHLFPNENPLGKRLRIGAPSMSLSDGPLWEIVGVVEDVSFDLGDRSGPVAYRPLAQQTFHSITLIVHTKGDPKAQIAAVRSAVQAIDDNLPAQEIKTLEEIVGLQFWPARMLAGLLAVLGSVG